MTLELAVRLTEILLGLALFQQSLEFWRASGGEQRLALVRAPLSVLLMLGVFPLVVCGLLFLTSFLLIKRFQGPYNGGSDTMSMLVLLGLLLSYLAPSRMWQEIALGYVVLQLVLSYFQAGLVKLVNPEWRSGKALYEVFALTAYPVSGSIRRLAQKKQLLFYACWCVIIAELLFPLAFFSQTTLIIALVCAGCFHLANAILFGLNRFVLAWLSAYPLALWFQQRLVELL